MATKPHMLYWDSCVFLSYIDAEEGRVDVIEGILEEIQRSKGTRKIVTSSVSIVEVAFGAQEKLKRTLDPSILAKIDALWGDTSVLAIIEYHDGIARIARDHMRDAMARSTKLTPLDAVHLASAQWLGAYEVQTYDDGLWKFEDVIGRKICSPYVLQNRIPGT